MIHWKWLSLILQIVGEVKRNDTDDRLIIDLLYAGGAAMLGTLGTLAYIMSNRKLRKKLDLMAWVGLLLGSMIGCFSAQLLLVRVGNIDPLIATVVIGPISLIGGNLGVILVKNWLDKIGIKIDIEEIVDEENTKQKIRKEDIKFDDNESA